jgi:hypothetical protein
MKTLEESMTKEECSVAESSESAEMRIEAALSLHEKRLEVLESLLFEEIRCTLLCLHPVHRGNKVGIRIQDLPVARCFRRGRVCKWLCYEEAET